VLIAAVMRKLSTILLVSLSVIEDFGNTSSASMGIAIDKLRRTGLSKAGDYLLFPAFAAGFTWGAALGRVGFPCAAGTKTGTWREKDS
jgi:3-oxoacyl-[acyl-carrier-protein] synthase III